MYVTCKGCSRTIDVGSDPVTCQCGNLIEGHQQSEATRVNAIDETTGKTVRISKDSKVITKAAVPPKVKTKAKKRKR